MPTLGKIETEFLGPGVTKTENPITKYATTTVAEKHEVTGSYYEGVKVTKAQLREMETSKPNIQTPAEVERIQSNSDLLQSYSTVIILMFYMTTRTVPCNCF